MGFAVPMLIATWLSCATIIAALLFSPETKGTVFVPDVVTYTEQKPTANALAAARTAGA